MSDAHHRDLGLPEAALELLAGASGHLVYIPNVVAAGLVDQLDQTLAWRQEAIKMYGRTLPLPRLTAWYGEPEAVYTYSGIRNVPLPWTELLLAIKERVETHSRRSFNSVLANRYADGSQHMSWHADDEAALGPEPLIASISCGSARRFVLKHRQSGEKIACTLGDGSLLLMSGRLQEEWLHALPKTTKPTGLRINLTFRTVHPQ